MNYFVLSSAGKPIYHYCGGSQNNKSRDFTTQMGVIQAIISGVSGSDSGDSILSFRSHGYGKLTFFLPPNNFPLYFVQYQEEQDPLPMQSQELAAYKLSYLYAQVLSALTRPAIERIFQSHANYNLNRLLEGNEVIVDRLCAGFQSNIPLMWRAIELVPIGKSIRDAISDILVAHLQSLPVGGFLSSQCLLHS